MTTRVVSALVAALTLFGLLAPAPALGQERGGADRPAPFDVDAALDALSEQRIYRAPGAIATFDEDLITRALTDDVRLLVTPSLRADEDMQRLEDWAEGTGRTLVHVEGLLVSSTDGITGTPSDLSTLRQHTAAHDVTRELLGVVRYTVESDVGDSSHAPLEVVTPTASQTADLVERLRHDRIVNASGRTDRVERSADELTRGTGFTVRVVAFPPLEPGEPLVDHAPALAERFPDDVVLVAHGDWLEVAGPQQAALTSARNRSYVDDAGYRAGPAMSDRIESVLTRARRLTTAHAFGAPQPRTSAHLVTDLAPWLAGGAALLIATTPLRRALARRWRDRRAERHAFLVTRAETFAALAELADQLRTQRDDSSPSVSAAAERHAHATALFDRATTATALKEATKLATRGTKDLRKRAENRNSMTRARRTRTGTTAKRTGNTVAGRTRTWARWPWGVTAAFVVGVVVFFLTMDPLRNPTERASAVVTEFVHDPVYVADDAPVDADRIRQLIGERAVVVAVLSGPVSAQQPDDAVSSVSSVSSRALCDDIAELVPTSMVLVFSFLDDESYRESACGGPDFPAPTLVDADAEDFLLDVEVSASDGERYHDSGDGVATQVAEYVLAFDDEASQAYGDLPRRGPIAEPPGGADLVLGLLAVVGSAIAAYLVLRDLGWMLLRSDLAHPRATHLRERLVRLGDRIMDPARPGDPETARNYARAFRELDQVRSPYDHHAVERRIERLEQDVTENVTQDTAAGR
ncbi:hypothetical protein [Saccharomonospora azurea]|uniref:hypothetical protein n=1 Tax=Saccharomonospora azurea TaxID=40988 RepID=UPI003D9115A8